MPDRRHFLKVSCAMGAALAAPGCLGLHHGRKEDSAMIRTVSGDVPADQIGFCLPHEHVLVDFIGADQVSRDRYDAEEVIARALPHLTAARDLGVRAVFECTPAWLGRDPELLARLGEASGLWLLTNTGYYGASGNKYLPRHAWTESAEQLAGRWIAEACDGIDETGIRPGFIKIGVDPGPLSPLHEKLASAAARTHLASSLSIASHTTSGQAAIAQLDVLRAEGVAATAWIWVHAQAEVDSTYHLRAAERGAWVEFDGLATPTIPRHLDLLANMKRHGFLNQVLLSHDAGWYHVGEPDGGEYRGYDTLSRQFLPALEKNGYSPEEITLLTSTNPARAFAVGVKQ